MKYRAIIAVKKHQTATIIKRAINHSNYNIKIIVINADSKEVVTNAAACGADIVFVDMDIAGGGGVETTRQIKRNLPGTHVVVISGDGDYELIRQAFIKGADDCLREKLQEDDVSKAVDRIIVKLKEEIAAKTERDEERQKFEIMFQLSKKSFIYHTIFMVKGKDASNLNEYQKVLELDERAYVVNVEFDESYYIKEIDENEIKNLLEDIVCRDRKVILGPVMFNRMMIIFPAGRYKKHEVAQKARQMGALIYESIMKKAGYKVCIGIGNVHRLEHIYLSYEESVKALRYDNNIDVMHYEDISCADKAFEIELINEDVNKIVKSLQDGSGEVVSIFGTVLKKLDSLNEVSRKNKILEILIYITHCVSDMGPTVCDYVNIMGISEEIAGVDSADIDTWALNRIQYIVKAVKSLERDRISEPVRFAKKYISDHYDQPVTLADVAGQIGVSTQYFSKIFKEETGYNFVNWLNTVRIKKASEIMLSKQTTIAETAYMVGYNDPNYFSRAFKKYTGMTPSQFLAEHHG